jgi:two-component system, OmpR family, sensor histidine kinase SenX3
MSTVPEFDYSILLANSIHEVKNSLNMLLNSVDQAMTNCDGKTCPTYDLFSQIQYEGKRVNDDMVGLLAIYRINNDQYSANIDEYSVLEFIEENLDQHETMIRHRNIDYELDCDEDLHWFFDRDLIKGVISNVINNLYKYTKDKLHISVVKEDGYLAIKVKDNGPGYPENMIVTHDQHGYQKNICFDNANTGLGLYFSELVAELHKNKGRSGFISTTNDGIDGGGCFAIYLP